MFGWGQPSQVSPRLRVSPSRTTVVAALPRTADRGSRAEDAAVGHASASNCCRNARFSKMRSARDQKHSRQPAEQVSKAHKHGSHPIRSAESDEACKSFKL